MKTFRCVRLQARLSRVEQGSSTAVHTVAFKAVAYLRITCGEYQAQCDCCTTFRTTPEGVLPRARYDNKVRDLVLDRILKDGMNVEQTMESLRRDFLLDLSTGFVYDVLRDRAEQLDMSEHRRKVLDNFSGILCVDELHLGRFTLLLATDPSATYLWLLPWLLPTTKITCGGSSTT